MGFKGGCMMILNASKIISLVFLLTIHISEYMCRHLSSFLFESTAASITDYNVTWPTEWVRH